MARKRVLIIDDEEGIRTLLRLTLNLRDFEADMAANGKEALEILEAGDLPGMILLDLMMPVMNGWKFLEALKERARWREIPVILISAFPEKAKGVEGVAGVLEKPIDVETLFAMVERYCGEGLAP